MRFGRTSEENVLATRRRTSGTNHATSPRPSWAIEASDNNSFSEWDPVREAYWPTSQMMHARAVGCFMSSSLFARSAMMRVGDCGVEAGDRPGDGAGDADADDDEGGGGGGDSRRAWTRFLSTRTEDDTVGAT